MVDECFKCGVSGERIRLFDAISGKGIVKICKECASKENIPIIRKPSEIFTHPVLYSDLKERGKTVYERLSRMSGFDSKDKKSEEKKEFLRKQETTLRDIMDKNFKIQIKEELKPRSDLVDNFHWVIMRARRSKHITQEQLADAIAEPGAAIKMIEKGTFPENSYKLISKLENYLGIKLVRKEFAEKIEEKPKEISFSPVTTKNLTIADLQEMKKKRENEVLNNSSKGQIREAGILGKNTEVSEDVEEMEDKTEKEDLF